MVVFTRYIVLGGAVVGLLYGGSGLVSAYSRAPGLPGPFELGVQAPIVGAFVALGAGVGFIVKRLAESILTKR